MGIKVKIRIFYPPPQDVETMAHLYADGHDPMQRAKVMKTRQ